MAAMGVEESAFFWAIAYVIALSVATLSTLSTLVFSFRNMNKHVSTVQYVMYSLCRSYLIYSASRWTFYLGVLCNWSGMRTYLDAKSNGQMLGVRVVYFTHEGKEVMLAIAMLGDIALLCTTFWIITLAYEMSLLIAKTMDRGAEKERKAMRHYNIKTFGAAILFGVMMLGSAWLCPHQETTILKLAFGFQLFCVWISCIYPLYVTIFLSVRKRLVTVDNPYNLFLHQRIRRLVIVYCVLVLPACLIESLLFCGTNIPLIWIGISQNLYYYSGAGTAFVFGVSVTCCYRTLQPIMPSSVYEHLLENGYFPDEVIFDPNMVIPPPTENPVFVCTDIEGSTALWASDPEAMSEAQSLHDDLLRRELIRFHGYEITTCGDAFQLAFHDVSDAIAWCMDVQEKLLKVQWPSELVKMDSAERVYDVWGRLVFNGLRVRMAIHDGDDKLICSTHPTTGKMTYLGVSELVARELGELGRGGEIFISDSALRVYHEHEKILLPHRVHESFVTECLEEPFRSPELQILFAVHRVIAKSMGDRFKREKEYRTDLAAARMILMRSC